MKILKKPSLAKFNTFHLPVLAREMVILESHEDYEHLSTTYDLLHENYLVVGDGSNILFRKDFDGIILTSTLDQVRVLNENDNYVWVEVDSGMNWHHLVLETLSMGYQGLENLSLIPGKVGAAPIQNIGAYGVEISQFIQSVTVMDIPSKRSITFSNEECAFGYRTSIFKTSLKNQTIVKNVQLRLNKIPEYNIAYDSIKETLDTMKVTELSAEAISEAVVQIRKNKLPDPDRIGNAGSFYKNPVVDKTDFEGLRAEFPSIRAYHQGDGMYKIPAAWLIEQCGWKGRRIKDAGVFPKHSLILVNYGHATGKEIYDLSVQIQKSVADKFGILLETEVNIL
jgi:UDP-N-acetylmuramate dehydrogenase